jgi:integrase
MQQAIVLAVQVVFPTLLPPSTCRGRGGNLAERFAVAASLPWAKLQPGQVGVLREQMQGQGYAPATVNRSLAALRGIVRQAWAAGDIDADRRERLLHNLGGVAGSRQPRGRHLSDSDLGDLFAACRRDESILGRRDAAALALMVVGLRRAEVVAVRVEDLTADGLRVVGKGNRERIVPITNGCLDAVQDWLRVRSSAPGPILCRCDGDTVRPSMAITTQAVYAALAKRARQASVLGRRTVACTPHDLRRTLVGRLLNAGADLSTVQAIVGHASPATTARYDRRPAEHRRLAMSALSIPYGRPAPFTI